MAHRWIHVEPIIFFYCLSGGLNSVLFQEFVYFKECVDFFHNAGNFSSDNDLIHFCQEFVNSKGSNESNSSSEERARIESNAAYFNIYYSLISTIPALFTTVLIGAWSDQHGRKGPLLFTLLTSILATVCIIILGTFPTKLSIYFLFIGAIVNSIGGQMLVVFMACFSAIADEYGENPEYYSFRVSVISVFLAFGFVAGSLVAGFLVDIWSYNIVYVVAEVVLIIAILYTIFFMHETLPPVIIPPMDSSSEISEPKDRPPTIMHKVISVMTLRHFYEVFQTVRNERKNSYFRIYLWIGLISFCLIFSADLGSSSLGLLFLKREPFYWADRAFGYFTAYLSGLSAVGVAVLSVIMKRWLGLPDISLILFGTFFDAMFKLCFAFARNTKQIIAVGILYSFATLCYPGYRSFLSKLVDSHETGKIFAIIAMIENVAPMIASVAFNSIFAETLHFFPGFVFLLAAVLILLTFFMMGFIHIHSWKNSINPGENQDKNPLVLNDDEDQNPEDVDWTVNT